MSFTKQNIIASLEFVAQFAFENLKKIEAFQIDLNNEIIGGFYIGYINRQYTLLNDLLILFKNKENPYLGTQLILFRCIIDDYIHLTYIINQTNSEDSVINYNADAISKNFNKLKELAELNEQKLGGNYPYYPTSSQLETIKENIIKNPNNQLYFNNIDEFKFKSFPSTTQIIKRLEDEPYLHKLQRAYFFWRRYSDFVHYSNFSFELERNIDPTKDSTYLEFAEIIQYSYQIIKNSLIYFENKYNLKIVDNNNLADYYQDTEH